MAKTPQAETAKVQPAEVNEEVVLTPIRDWLSSTQHGKLIVDQDQAYPLVLKAMGIGSAEANATQLETAFQLIKMKVQDIAADLPNRPEGPVLIFFEGAPDNKHLWRQEGKAKTTPPGGSELRELYQRVRSKL